MLRAHPLLFQLALPLQSSLVDLVAVGIQSADDSQRLHRHHNALGWIVSLVSSLRIRGQLLRGPELQHGMLAAVQQTREADSRGWGRTQNQTRGRSAASRAVQSQLHRPDV